MFKKTLLALSVAGAAFGAQAGTIYSSATNPTVGALAGQINTASNNCNDAVTLATLTALNSAVAVVVTGADAGTAGGADDTVTYNTGLFSASNSVVTTAANACTVKAKTTVTASTAKSSVENKSSINVSAAIVAGLGGYRIEDTITINFTGAKINPAIVPTLTTAASGATFELLDITSTTVRYTVKTGSADVPGSAILNLSGVRLDTTGLTTGSSVSIDTFATNTSGTKYDVIGATKIHELVPQYSAAVTRKLDGIINVSDDRQSLVVQSTAPTDLVDEDTLILTVTKDSTEAGNDVVADFTTITLTGDFNWIATKANTSNDGVAVTPAEVTTYLNSLDMYKYAAGAFGDADSYTLNATYDTLTIKDTTNVTNAATAAAAYTLKLKVPGKAAGNPVLATQKFTAAVTVSDATATPNTVVMNALSATDAGEWKLNGSVVTIPYMPFDDNTAVIMRHTNTGVQTGDMTIRYMLEGVDTDWVSAGVIGQSSRGVKDIRDLVINAIKTKSGKVSGKAAIEITTNVPSADVTVYAGFRVKDENDRGFVGTFGEHGSAK